MKFDACTSGEIKFVLTFAKQIFHSGSYFTLRSNISLAERRISLKKAPLLRCFFHGDPDENRTRVTAVKGRCLNRLTTGPYFEELCSSIFNTPAGKKVDLVAEVGLEPTTCRV